MLLSSTHVAREAEWCEVASVQHEASVLCVSVHPTHTGVFFTGFEKVYKIGRDRNVEPIVPPSPGKVIRAIKIHSDGRIAVALGSTVQIWCNNACLDVYECENTICGLSWIGDDLIIASEDLTVCGVAFSETSDNVMAFASNNRYQIWSSSNPASITYGSIPSTSSSFSCAVVGPTRAVFGCSDGTVLIVPAGVGGATYLHRVFGHTKNVRDVSISKDEKRCVTASYDCTLRILCLDTGKTLQVLDNTHTAYVTGCRFFDRDDSYVVSVSSDSTMKVFDLHFADRERLQALMHRPRKGPKQHLPIEVMRKIKSLLFAMNF